MMKAINSPLLICPGVIKAGTTLIYEVLKQSPLLSTAREKEVHFFSYGLETDNKLLRRYRSGVRHAGSSIENYLRYFAHKDRIWCDISPSYLGWPKFRGNVQRLATDPYFLVITRNRLSRAMSSWRHAVRAGLEAEPFAAAVFRDFRKQDPYEYPLRKYFQLSDYDGLMGELVADFGKTRVATIGIDGIKAREIASALDSLLGRDLRIPQGIDLGKLESNPARSVGSHQFVMKWLLKNHALLDVGSKLLPKSHALRGLLARFAYRGKVQEDQVPDKQIAQIRELFIGEFGML